MKIGPNNGIYDISMEFSIYAFLLLSHQALIRCKFL